MDFAWNKDGSDSDLLKRMSKSKDVNTLAVDILKLWERAGTKDDPAEQVKERLVLIIGINDFLQVPWAEVQPMLVEEKLMPWKK